MLDRGQDNVNTLYHTPALLALNVDEKHFPEILKTIEKDKVAGSVFISETEMVTWFYGNDNLFTMMKVIYESM